MGSGGLWKRRRTVPRLIGLCLLTLAIAACSNLPVLGAMISGTGQARDLTILYSGYVKGTLEPVPGCT